MGIIAFMDVNNSKAIDLKTVINFLEDLADGKIDNENNKKKIDNQEVIVHKGKTGEIDAVQLSRDLYIVSKRDNVDFTTFSKRDQSKIQMNWKLSELKELLKEVDEDMSKFARVEGRLLKKSMRKVESQKSNEEELEMSVAFPEGSQLEPLVFKVSSSPSWKQVIVDLRKVNEIVNHFKKRNLKEIEKLQVDHKLVFAYDKEKDKDKEVEKLRAYLLDQKSAIEFGEDAKTTSPKRVLVFSKDREKIYLSFSPEELEDFLKASNEVSSDGKISDEEKKTLQEKFKINDALLIDGEMNVTFLDDDNKEKPVVLRVNKNK